jgi:hypothetical protein
MALRRGTGRRSAPRKRSGSRLEELTERTRQEGRALSQRRRADVPRLRPVVAPAAGFASWVAPYITGALMFVIKLLAALIALTLEIGLVVIRWTAGAVYGWALVIAEATRRHVTPRSTVAFVGVAAAVGLGISQFFDYHGVAVDAPGYAGRLGAEVPVPITGRETAGSAHFWVLLPVAAVAAILMLAGYRGRPRLARLAALCGLIGLAVAVSVDLPQGLEVGRPGLAFNGTEAQLLQGFWSEVACSAVLILCGGLLAHYSRGMTRERKRRPREAGGDMRRAPHQEVSGVNPGLQAGP